MATISPRLSLPAAHEYVRAPADMHPRLARLTSPNITKTGFNSREPQASTGLTGGNPTFRTHGMIRPAQVVAAVGATPALAADYPARGERREGKHPQNRSVEDRVDREPGSDGQ